MLRTLYCTFWLVLFSLGLKADYEISGSIMLPEGWETKIYLSAIFTLDDLNTVADEFIIAESEIGQDGSFGFEGYNLPGDDRIYRLHICKKGDPISTIIIGGREENHVHFVMNNDSRIRLMAGEYDLLFRNASWEGHQANALLSDLETLKVDLAQQQKSQKNQYYRNSRKEELYINFADTCNHFLVSLIALNSVNLARTFNEHGRFYQDFISKWENKHHKSPYFKEFKRELEFMGYDTEKNTSIPPFLTFALIVSGICAIYLLYQRRQVNLEGESLSQKQANPLSLQERKVYRLISQGKSNKEISSELHIGISTVKSHVHSIFKKLGIKSRKEVQTPD
ncbi:MAG: helix-turn-helix transcriptional regulator [Bacteroidota bacterium]